MSLQIFLFAFVFPLKTKTVYLIAIENVYSTTEFS